MKVRLFTGMMALLAACGGQTPQDRKAADLTFHQKQQVTIDTPAAGAFLAISKDGMVDVAGAAHGRSITVNGISVAVDSSGHFHTRVPAVPRVNLVTSRLNGLLGGGAHRAFLYGDFVASAAQPARGVMA